MDPYTSIYDAGKKATIYECELEPSKIWRSEEITWLWAINEQYEDCDDSTTGKWMLFFKEDKVDSVWLKIKESIKTGHLWHAKVAPKTYRYEHAIMVYTPDYNDIDHVIQVLDYLETSGIKSPSTPIFYKTNNQTRAGIYRGGKEKPWIYASSTIRNLKEKQQK